MKKTASFLLSLAMASTMVVSAKTYYASPTGTASGTGTKASPWNITTTQTSKLMPPQMKVLQPGDSLVLLEGKYQCTYTLRFQVSGNASKRIFFVGEEGKKVVVQGPTTFNSSNRGIQIEANYWHVKNIICANSGDNGMFIGDPDFKSGADPETAVCGKYNVIENCTFIKNQDTGCQLSNGAAFNLILNCDAVRNFDKAANGANGDGFACKLTPGAGNVFKGCRSWHNADDGWDLFTTPKPIIIDSCITWRNSDYNLLLGTTPPAKPGSWGGNGQGFKLGSDKAMCATTVRNCIAFDCNYGQHAFKGGNTKGIDQNHNLNGCYIYNNLSFGNWVNYSLWEACSKGKHVLRNNMSFGTTHINLWDRMKPTQLGSVDNKNNNFDVFKDDSVLVNYKDEFVSLDTTLADAPRQADGSLPNTGFGQLKAGSKYIDAGTTDGISTVDATYPTSGKISNNIIPVYYGAAPEIGPWEYKAPTALNDVVAEMKNPALATIAVAPNVIDAETTVEFSVEQAATVQISAYDIHGRKFDIQSVSASKGVNSITVNVSKLEAGYYIIVVSTSNQLVGKAKAFKN